MAPNIQPLQAAEPDEHQEGFTIAGPAQEASANQAPEIDPQARKRIESRQRGRAGPLQGLRAQARA